MYADRAFHARLWYDRVWRDDAREDQRLGWIGGGRSCNLDSYDDDVGGLARAARM